MIELSDILLYNYSILEFLLCLVYVIVKLNIVLSIMKCIVCMFSFEIYIYMCHLWSESQTWLRITRTLRKMDTIFVCKGKGLEIKKFIDLDL